MNATVRHRAPVPSMAIATGSIRTTVRLRTAYDDDGPAQVAERGLEQRRAEHGERRGAEQRAELLDEVADLAADTPADSAEDHPADERRDEPRAAGGGRRAVGEHRARDGDDLEPGRLDEAAP